MSKAYWQKRLEAEMAALQRSETTLRQEYERLYRVYTERISKEISAFYQRYAEDEGVSLSAAKKMVSQFDVQAFADKAAEYVREKNFGQRANEELKLYNLKMRVSRLQMLQQNLRLEMVALANEEESVTRQVLESAIGNEFRRQAGVLGMSVPSQERIRQHVEAIIRTPFKGAEWSDRIWKRQSALQTVVSHITERGLIEGINATEFIARLKREFQVNTHEAHRLAVTEMARVQTESQRQSYLSNGFTEYIYSAEPTACPVCARLDGKVFKTREMTPGTNAAPMHPHCHCSTAPYESRERLDEMFRRMEEQQEFRLSALDAMGRKRLFEIDSAPYKDRLSAQLVEESPYNMWTQGRTKPYRDTLRVINDYYSRHPHVDRPQATVVVGAETKMGLAGYDPANDVLYLKNIFGDLEAVVEMFRSDYYAVKDFDDLMAHELGHKRHWDAAERLYKKSPKKYNSVEEAKRDLDEPINQYVSNQLANSPSYLLNLSENADDAYRKNNINELIADMQTKKGKSYDPELYKLIEEVLDNARYTTRGNG